MAICLEYQSVYSSRRESSASLRFHLVASVLLLAALVVRVTIKMQSTRIGYELARAQKESVELDMGRRELELQRSVLLRPDNLERAGRGLGLLPLNAEQARKVKIE